MSFDNLSVSLFKDFSAKEWDQLLDYFDETINYTAWFLGYIEVLNTKSGIKNLSFVVFDNGKPIALVPIYIEEIDANWQISMGQEHIDAPIFSRNTPADVISEYYKYIVIEIDRIASQYQCTLARFRYSPLLHTKASRNHFSEFGYRKSITYPNWYIFKVEYSYVINLLVEEGELYRCVRKSNKPNINRTRREAKLLILDKDNFDQIQFEQYVQLYYKVKGKKRSADAFGLDSIAIKEGFEVLLLCQYKDVLVGAVALHTHNRKARYNSSVQDYDVDKFIYSNHFLLWESIVYLKKKGFDLFEIGEQVSASADLSSKEKNLSHFKAGWGGVLTPWMQAQKEFKHV